VSKRAEILREKLGERRGLIVPGAANALSARIIESIGFEAIYLTGAGIANTFLGLPDLGFLSSSELTEHTFAIRDRVDLPLVVDADTGFGGPLQVRHTVRALERAGADAIQIEDQIFPKRCGHFPGKEVITAEEMTEKVKAAVDARQSGGLLIIARTDARAVHGFRAAIDRAGQYTEAGADATFVEAPQSIDEMQEIPALLRAPQVVNIVLGGQTPIVAAAELAVMRFGMVLYANAALQGAIAGMQVVLSALKARGLLDETSAGLASFAERQRLIEKPLFDDLERKYSVKKS
jgi:2-methylisocitrate lyase-like PEP mutase family enzyme